MADARTDLTAKIVAKAAQDSHFLQALKSDPKKALADAFGINTPANVSIDVLEETAAKKYVVLPNNSAKLSDAELAGVAGGSSISAAYCG